MRHGLSPCPAIRPTSRLSPPPAFGQRRKMLRQSLKALGVDPAALCVATGIDPTARAETIPVKGFVDIANAWKAMR